MEVFMTGVHTKKFKCVLSGELPDARTEITHTPVSYTHLDVYKRQVKSVVRKS